MLQRFNIDFSVLYKYHHHPADCCWLYCQKFSFRSCFGGDFWRAAKTGSRRVTCYLLLLAGSQRRCSVDRAGALKVCLRSV